MRRFFSLFFVGAGAGR